MIVYRGLSITPEELNKKYKIGNKISLQGFTSSTLNRNIAVAFSGMNKSRNDVEGKGKVPVLIELEITGNHQFIVLNSKDLTSFPEEEEVILQDGILYECVGVKSEDIQQGEGEEPRKLNIVSLKNVPDKYASSNKYSRVLKLLLN